MKDTLTGWGGEKRKPLAIEGKIFPEIGMTPNVKLSQRFLHHFSINKRYPKTASYLFTIIQQEQESLWDYIQRFSEAVLEVPHLNHELLASILQHGLWRGRLRQSIAGKLPTILDELLNKAAKYIRIEQALKPKVDSSNKRKIREGETKPCREGLAEGQMHMPPDGFAKYTPLKAPKAEILTVAERQGIMQWPRKMKDNPKRLKFDKYCRFHKDRGHNTEDCNHLKNEIEKLIQRGYLKEYVENNPSGVIGVVTGGPAGGDSAHAHKALVRAASTFQEIDSCREVIITGMPEEEITFSSSDLEKGVTPHNDALVISAAVSNFWVKKVLVDTGNAADILFFAAFSQMGIGVDMLTKVNTPLVGFTGSVVEPMGEIALPISIGIASHRATRMLKFLVVDAPSSYNVIMGRPSLNSFRAVASTYHMKLKFPVYRGIGEEKGDRHTVRECHANILKKKSKPPVE
ncbi:UNVERIFIED_CONTAM: hypothetical protein Sradi_2944100 [Sesamum radiatum]|uniref:Retrotransposon gag domain-containing protein n=1 Tax=Sesamum radiatum TaxID=300843 RepID=A0AAW2RZ37_SESRA